VGRQHSIVQRVVSSTQERYCHGLHNVELLDENVSHALRRADYDISSSVYHPVSDIL